MTTTSTFVRSAAVLSILGLTLAACGTEDTDDGDNGDEPDTEVEDNGTDEATGEGGEIDIAVFQGWEEGIVATYLWDILLTEQGYEVTQTELEPGVAYAGLADGDLDLNLDAWLPVTHEGYWDDYGDDLEDLGPWNEEALLTIAVNEDAPIDSLEELADAADEFGNTIYGIEPGAGLTDITENSVIPEYELEDMDFLTSSTPAMIAELDSAIAAGENVVVTLWRPHWTYGAYPIRDLEDPEETLGDAEGIHSVARDGFSEDFPEVAQWLGDFEMDSEQLSDLLDHVFADEPSPDEYRDLVQEWMDDNEDYVSELTG